MSIRHNWKFKIMLPILYTIEKLCQYYLCCRSSCFRTDLGLSVVLMESGRGFNNVRSVYTVPGWSYQRRSIPSSWVCNYSIIISSLNFFSSSILPRHPYCQQVPQAVTLTAAKSLANVGMKSQGEGTRNHPTSVTAAEWREGSKCCSEEWHTALTGTFSIKQSKQFLLLICIATN